MEVVAVKVVQHHVELTVQDMLQVMGLVVFAILAKQHVPVAQVVVAIAAKALVIPLIANLKVVARQERICLATTIFMNYGKDKRFIL